MRGRPRHSPDRRALGSACGRRTRGRKRPPSIRVTSRYALADTERLAAGCTDLDGAQCGVPGTQGSVRNACRRKREHQTSLTSAGGALSASRFRPQHSQSRASASSPSSSCVCKTWSPKCQSGGYWPISPSL
jgi:hypothetical protein